jgi:hypothetical protein
MSNPLRVAQVKNADSADQLRRYLPGNYAVLGPFLDGEDRQGGFIIGGRDKAGWTLDDYVIPRLASGLIWAEEITERAALEFLVEAL